jgi:homoserine dehydrogenase
MKHYRLSFLGFGNVGRTLARLLIAKRDELREGYGVEFELCGVATRRMGWLYADDAIDATAFLEGRESFRSSTENIHDWLAKTRPDVLFETTSLNPQTGQPAIDYMRAALEANAHVITANKAPIVYAFDEINELAKSRGRRFLFESTVLDSAPVFSLFRETLPLMKVRGFTGIFNSTTNVILETMEQGRSFDEGVRAAQELGVAETDPTNDIDGWDATMKVCAISRVILKTPLLPRDVLRESIRGLTSATVQSARAEGKPYKMLTRAKVSEDGSITAWVRPEQIALTDPLGGIRGTSLAVHFEGDMIPGLTVISHRPNLQSTAYGLLADFVNICRGD